MYKFLITFGFLFLVTNIVMAKGLEIPTTHCIIKVDNKEISNFHFMKGLGVHEPFDVKSKDGKTEQLALDFSPSSDNRVNLAISDITIPQTMSPWWIQGTLASATVSSSNLDVEVERADPWHKKSTVTVRCLEGAPVIAD